MKLPFRYKAYISYSHKNERWAKWLLRAIESYRVPRKLVGMTTWVGVVPARIRPVFRDRDEMSSASNLADTINDALLSSENLLVICSPEAARSHWVNEEIRAFAKMGKADHIFCVIVDGEPDGTDAAQACFPPALAEIGLSEPLAADVRSWADGKHLSRLKLISAMLSVSLDQLRRRDLQKRQKNWAIVATASMVVAAVLVVAVTSRISAQQRRISGESLVELKLKGLRTLLVVSEDPENLSRLKKWKKSDIEKLLAQAGNGGQALSAAGLKWRQDGDELFTSGDLKAAMEKYRQSWVFFAEDYRRNNGNLNSLFEVGQAEFYIGQVYMGMGNFVEARAAFTNYAEITRRLIIRQPKNAEWVLEMAYALTNLGVLQDEEYVDQPERRLQLIQSALEYNQIALVLDPDNRLYQSELGQSHAFLADAQRDVCDLEGALESRQNNVMIEQQALDADSTNLKIMTRLAQALSGYSLVQTELGQDNEARQSLKRALELMRLTALQHPEDTSATLFLLQRQQRLISLRPETQDQSSDVELGQLAQQWREFKTPGLTLSIDVRGAYIDFLLERARRAASMGNIVLADQLLSDSFTELLQILANMPAYRQAENQLVLAAYQYWQLSGQLPPETVLSRLPVYVLGKGRTRACNDASMAARKSLMLGDSEAAASFSEYLLNNSYHEDRFMQFCKSFSLCTGY